MTAPTMQLRIEKLKRRDLRHVLPIESVVFPEPWSVAVFNSELALRHGRLYRGAWDGHQLAGYIGFLIVGEEAHITTIAVAPTYQRAGVASTLIIDGIRTLLLSGVKHLSLEVAANNEPAQALYRRFGFAPVGVRENYYPVTGQDAIIMWVHDIDTPAYARGWRSSADRANSAYRASRGRFQSALSHHSCGLPNEGVDLNTLGEEFLR